MKKRILTFNGGLQTKVAPHLIEPNEATECANVDLTKGSLYPLKGLTTESTLTGIYAFHEDGNVVVNSDPTDIRSYARFGSRLYWSNSTYSAYGLMRYDGTSAGVEAAAPVTPDGTVGLATTGTNGSLNGSYVYTYTYVDTDGIESAPAGYVNVSVTNQNVDITITGETNTPADIDFRRFYRTGGSNPTFNLVGESTGLTYSDTTRDIDVSRIELATLSNFPPPVDLDNLVENNGTMWGSVGDKLYFSINGHPEYWNPLDYVVLNDNITGIGKFADIIVVLTRADAYTVTGYNRDTITLNKLPYREGCVNHRSIANVGDYLVWVSKNGVCVYNGSSVVVATRNLLSWNDLARAGTYTWDELDSTYDANIGYDVVSGIAFQGNYYGAFNGGVGILRLDDQMVASTISVDNAKTIYYDDINNYLTVVSDDDGTYNARSIDTNTETYSTALWKTGQIQDDGYDIKKHYRRVKFDAEPISVTVYTDDKEFTVTNRKEFFLPSGFIGRYIQFEITTSVEIRSCTYEYGLLA